MSSNNQLIVTKKKEKFEVHLNSCVGNDFTPDKESLLKTFNSILHAIRFANNYCNEYPYVEYGTYVCPSCYKEIGEKEK